MSATAETKTNTKAQQKVDGEIARKKAEETLRAAEAANGDAGDTDASLTEKGDPTPEITEWDPIMPELTAGGTVVVAESEIQLAKRSAPGVEVRIKPLRTRQLLRIGRVLTGSSRPVNVYQMVVPFFEAGDDPAAQNAAAYSAFGALAVTIPHSEREFIELVNDIVDPADDLDNEQARLFFEYMDNPEMSDTIKVISQAVTNERHRAGDLGKMLLTLLGNRGNEATSS